LSHFSISKQDFRKLIFRNWLSVFLWLWPIKSVAAAEDAVPVLWGALGGAGAGKESVAAVGSLKDEMKVASPRVIPKRRFRLWVCGAPGNRCVFFLGGGGFESS